MLHFCSLIEEYFNFHAVGIREISSCGLKLTSLAIEDIAKCDGAATLNGAILGVMEICIVVGIKLLPSMITFLQSQ